MPEHPRKHRPEGRLARTVLLACALRNAREDHDWGLRELSRRTFLSPGLLSNWELGQRSPRPDDVTAILSVIGVNKYHRDRLIDLARIPEELVLALGTPGKPDHVAAAEDCARRSGRIDIWNPLTVPVALRTPDYAEAMTGPRLRNARPARAIPEAAIPAHARGDVRKDAVTVFIGEQVLAGLAREPRRGPRQIEHLAGHVDGSAPSAALLIRVVPDRAGYHRGLEGAVTRYHTEAGPVDYRPGGFSGSFALPGRKIGAVPADGSDVFAQLEAVALDAAESADLITDHASLSGADRPHPRPARPAPGHPHPSPSRKAPAGSPDRPPASEPGHAKARWVELYRAGKTTDEIADAENETPDRIKYWVRKLGMELRPPGVLDSDGVSGRLAACGCTPLPPEEPRHRRRLLRTPDG
ncbi:Scr1 family TA system antitoxin-like transcriptional regulator [Amycolatopsis rubida]|uniref:Helix-turn-helix domain-containing protein n=1 Tax=Amycolatopsis rubida TaxID=112413 RepID=A0A1I5E3G2_9PSEU|nr:Scr1 family TA system antitoxin-like transcriptional regulator [Amycolatopsis rubida]SFO06022.1 Helix-turn-helix domain-containing protein [Amycolatopsis rubida]